jgi:hypothetical protein
MTNFMKKQFLFSLILLLLGIGAFVFASFSYQNPKHPFFKSTDNSFKEFLGQFPQKDLPFGISQSYAAALLDSMKNQEYRYSRVPDSLRQKPMNKSYLVGQKSRFLNTSMARNPIVTFPVAQFAIGEKIATLYSKNNFQSAFQNNVGYCSYVFSVFDAEGHLITETECGHIYPNSVATFLIKSDLNICGEYYSIIDTLPVIARQTNGFLFERDTVIDTKKYVVGIDFYKRFSSPGAVFRTTTSN